MRRRANKNPAAIQEQGRLRLIETCKYLSSKAKTSTGALDRARSDICGAYRCGTALDFDQLPLLGPSMDAPAVSDSVLQVLYAKYALPNNEPISCACQETRSCKDLPSSPAPRTFRPHERAILIESTFGK